LKNLTIGILGLQGDLEEHTAATRLALERMKLNGSVTRVKTAKEAETVDGLIIPGGESTVIGQLAAFNRTLESIKARIQNGMPVLGTCAGLIMLARKTYDRVVGETIQPILGVMDIVVQRNSFGRQRDSFETDLEIPFLGEKKFKGVFIRSPTIREAGSNVKILSRFNDTIVAVKDHNIIGTAFHPELTNDSRLHEYFLHNIAETSTSQ
jgi:5'-phosphate synthase pdxT subunit